MSDEQKFVEIVEKSGNAFHAKVAEWLKAAGWSVMISPYYMDHGTGKAREIDIVAEKVCHRRESHRHKTILVVVRLYVECKYVPAPCVFWFSDRDQKAVEQLVCSTSPFRMDNSSTLGHHYLKGSRNVAKVFASTSSREPENEPFYKALNQVLNGSASLSTMNSFVSGLPERSSFSLKELEFPVVVVDSFQNLRKVQFYGAAAPEPITENFQLEVRYAFTQANGLSRNEFLLIDIVDFGKLDKYTGALDSDAEIMGHLS